MSALNAKQWANSVSLAELPVFPRTIAELGKLALRGERAPLPEITEVVLHDPLLTLRLLAAVNHRKSRLGAEITTVEHAIMMMGVQPFFNRFAKLPSVEEHLKSNPGALAAVRRLASRAHHAAYQARDWAIHRSDIESEEVFVAAMLATVPAMVLWCLSPEKAEKLGQPDAEFSIDEACDGLLSAQKIPELLRELMDAGKSSHPRALNVALALAIARHAERSWYGEALVRDIEAAAAFLHLTPDDMVARIHRTAVLAARAWKWYGAIPAAAWLPYPPPPPEPEAGPTTGAAAAPRTSQDLVAWTLATLRGEGMGRVMFALASPDRQWLKAKWVEGAAPDSPLAGMALSLAKHNLFAQLLGKPQCVWLHDANRDNLKPFLSGELTKAIGHGDFFAMSIFLKDKPLGLLYADGRNGEGKKLDEHAYQMFKQVGGKLSQGLAQFMGAKS
jgi:hypothetical protein